MNLNKQNRVKQTSGEHKEKRKCDGVTYCGPDISQYSGVLHAYMHGSVL